MLCEAENESANVTGTNHDTSALQMACRLPPGSNHPALGLVDEPVAVNLV